ncbi:hypothetical protein LTR78_006924 [Recurvomyces mirabilis]|uniref:AB hydrolase-1 domain-containing protein n=1 Tax=Recurvomyces mirabilis TaxID=574656 RepID=A0AAE1BYZ6_9PEZI|nr:hypothetical protein LTR78_006924 [Recurvomyces mirabilis]KAK5153308.1 hypothetical protein LTS14_007477 [Recurvomyces mirabilis]
MTMQISQLFPTALLGLASQSPLTFASEATKSEVTSFKQTGLRHSYGGNAICTTGDATVTVNATDLVFSGSTTASQYEISGILREALQINSTWTADHTNGTAAVTGPFKIAVQLCLPTKSTSENYSYVNAAAEACHATLMYDRLGLGGSDLPDPSIVQSFVHVEVLAALVGALKTDMYGSHHFSKVACVGHSHGSFIQIGHDVKYPNVGDAAILTGFGSDLTHVAQSVLAGDATVARDVDPARFGDLPDGYLTNPNAASLMVHYRYPYYDTRLFEQQLPIAGSTFSLADVITSGLVLASAKGHTKPVQVVLGQYDFTFCSGDCSRTADPTIGAVKTFYPDAEVGEGYIVPTSGHCINNHYASGEAFAHMLGLLKEQGL